MHEPKSPFFEAKIIEHYAVLSEHGSVTKEFNLVSFGGNKPKYDIRLWKEQEDTEGKKPFKGVTLTVNELIALKDCLLSDKLILTQEEEPEPVLKRKPGRPKKPRAAPVNAIDKGFNPETVISENDLLKILRE